MWKLPQGIGLAEGQLNQATHWAWNPAFLYMEFLYFHCLFLFLYFYIGRMKQNKTCFYLCRLQNLSCAVLALFSISSIKKAQWFLMV